MDGDLERKFTHIDNKLTRVEGRVIEIHNGQIARNNAWVRVLLTGAVAGTVIAVSRHIPVK